MKHSPNRLEPSESGVFDGHQIDRSRPLRFRINGRMIHGFEGDTVLSAVLAAGISSAGKHRGNLIALDQNLGLCVKLHGADDLAEYALPIERTPAVDRIDMQTFQQQPAASSLGWLHGLASAKSTTLGLDFDANITLPGPFSLVPTTREEHPGVVIVGGGLAGLSAAIHAAKRKKNVTLVERRPYLGGDAVLFGHRSGEQAPQDAIDALVAELTGHPRVTILKYAEVINIEGDELSVHQIVLVDGVPRPNLIKVKCSNIVLATGGQDRLPIFGGNRLPGVLGLSAAFEMASAYGVSPGDQTIIVTNNNFAYRMAVLCNDANAPVQKLIDTRIDPKSRFAEFAKAHGVKSEPGLNPLRVNKSPRTQLLFLKTALSWNSSPHHQTLQQAGAIVTSGGWLKRLPMLTAAGGTLDPSDEGELSATKVPKTMALAGYVAGYESNTAIQQSGREAVEQLLAGKTEFIEDVPIDPDFESPIGDFPISTILEEPDLAPVYLDNSNSLMCLTPPDRKGLLSSMFSTGENKDASVAVDHALSIADLATQVALGKVESESFGILCQERAVFPKLFVPQHEKTAPDKLTDPDDKEGVAPFLVDRFGDKATRRYIEGPTEQQFEQGNLIFANSDTHDPTKALGVILTAGVEQRPLAFLSRELNEKGARVSVKGASGHMDGIIGGVFKSRK